MKMRPPKLIAVLAMAVCMLTAIGVIVGVGPLNVPGLLGLGLCAGLFAAWLEIDRDGDDQ